MIFIGTMTDRFRRLPAKSTNQYYFALKAQYRDEGRAVFNQLTLLENPARSTTPFTPTSKEASVLAWNVMVPEDCGV